MTGNEQRPDRTKPMQGDNIINVGGVIGQDKDTQNLCNEKHKSEKKESSFLKRTLIVYRQLRKSGAGTVNMVDVELKFKGYDFDTQQVRQSLWYLVKNDYIRYWGRDKCSLTGHVADWFEMPCNPKKVFTIKMGKGQSYGK